MTTDDTFTLGFVRGVSPDKWVKRWHEVRERGPLLIEAVAREGDPQSNTATVTLVRVPEGSRPHGTDSRDRTRHAVALYTEKLALIVPKDHELAGETLVTKDDLELVELIDYEGYDERWPTPQPWLDASYRPKNLRGALDLVSTGLGLTLAPLPLARALSKKAEHRVIEVQAGLPSADIFAVWQVADDSDRVQELIGVLRGRGSRSSR